jgi:hypothetical protein
MLILHYILERGHNMIETYNPHGTWVFVDSKLKGMHREHCLCSRCKRFKPNTSDNCIIAQENFRLCVQYKITTPVYECPKFETTEQKHANS